MDTSLPAEGEVKKKKKKSITPAVEEAMDTSLPVNGEEGKKKKKKKSKDENGNGVVELNESVAEENGESKKKKKKKAREADSTLDQSALER